MNMKLCPNSHYYDALQHAECPHCKGNAASPDIGMTVPLQAPAPAAPMAVPVGTPIGATTPVGAAVPAFAAQPAVVGPAEGSTMPIMKEKFGTDPVVGWLVCIEGKDVGKDYRIHTDYNHIGRSPNMDISITGDDTISRENHATIGYDAVEKIFIFGKNQGRGIVRVNGKAVMSDVVLKPYDTIEIGNSKLKFVPFCGDSFEWEKGNS
ncbi:MAG: FHA domain-containing protein [Oscillospiraceae bacterium]|nr:FHA domain-containing protein [Oscillospiraceae bacterium]